MSDQPGHSPASDTASSSSSSSDRPQTGHALPLPPAGMLSGAAASASSPSSSSFSYDAAGPPASAPPHAEPRFAWLNPLPAQLAPPPPAPFAVAAAGRPLWDAYVQREAAIAAQDAAAAAPPQLMTPEEREAARDLALRTMLVVASVGAEAGTHDGQLDAPVEAALAALLIAQDMVDEAPPPPSPAQSVAFVKKLHLQLEQLQLQQQLQPLSATLALHLSQPDARQAAARLALIFAISGFVYTNPTMPNIGWLSARLNASRLRHGEKWRDVSDTEEAAALRVAVETLPEDQARLPSHHAADAFAAVLLQVMKTAGQSALEQASQEEEEEDEEESQRAPVRRGRGGTGRPRGRGSRGSTSQPRGKRPAAAAAAAPMSDADATQPKQRSPRGRGGRGGGAGGGCDQAAGPESSSGQV